MAKKVCTALAVEPSSIPSMAVGGSQLPGV